MYMYDDLIIQQKKKNAMRFSNKNLLKYGRNSYKSDLFLIFSRNSLDFFFDSAIIGFQNP